MPYVLNPLQKFRQIRRQEKAVIHRCCHTLGLESSSKSSTNSSLEKEIQAIVMCLGL